jgi:hypothetical protein
LAVPPLRKKILEAGEAWTRRIARAAAGLELARSPALAGMAHGVPGLLEEIGEHVEAGRQETPEVAAFRELVRRCPVRIAAREGVHDGAAVKARRNSTPSRAIRSKAGVATVRSP